MAKTAKTTISCGFGSLMDIDKLILPAFRSGTFSVLGSGFAAQADFYRSIRVLHNGWKILFR